MSEWTGVASSGDIVGIPTNILTLHTNDLLFEAMPVMRYDQFAVVRTDLTVQPGGTIQFSKYGNLALGGAIAESADVVLKSMSKSVIPITVTEYINAVGITAKFQTLSFMDEMYNASILLGRDYAVVTDCMLRDALFSASGTYLADNVFDISNVTGAFDLDDVDNVVTLLATGNVLKYVDANGEYYVGFFHPHQLQPIKKALIAIRQYAYPELIFKGEVGEYNGVRFIETSNVPNGAAGEGVIGYDETLVEGYGDYGSYGNLATNLYKGVIFGERAYAWAVAKPVELREDPGFSTFGRKMGLAWYAIMGADVLVEENIIVVITA